MSAETHHATLPPSQLWEQVEECVYRYEVEHREGRPRPLDHYLPPGNSPWQREILVELIKVELELDAKRGTALSLREYCQRYSLLGHLDQLPADLVYEAYLAARWLDNSLDLARFCADFPVQRASVLELARRTGLQSTALVKQRPGGQWQVGTCCGDFQLLALLGEGAFGRVFLANQLSLNRQVALKVTANRGSEARTMASLEHEHIVQVFSELVLPEFNARLLCMQYIAGTTLGKVIRFLRGEPHPAPRGERIIAAIDELSTLPAAFQAAALKQRQRLADADVVETITLLGSQLAEALAYAHQHGVLHRDIKPDNVLLSQYGRPLLVDFNLALDPHAAAGTTAGMFGGSVAYMSPEHVDAFNPANATPPEAVDQRSDIYSLGVTLYELFHLTRPFPDPPQGHHAVQQLEQMAAERRAGGTSRGPSSSAETDVLDAVIKQCLEPVPTDRFQTATELCEAFDAARQMQAVRKTLPPLGRLLRAASRYPLTLLMLAVLVPSILGSAVNISYNMLRILPELTSEQGKAFLSLALNYNLVVYPFCTAILIVLAYRIFFPAEIVDRARLRRRIVTLPFWIVVLGTGGWLPGGVLFPVGIHAVAGPLAPAMFEHFLIDFLLSGMIAVTYSYFGAELIMLRVLYPKYLVGERQPREAARGDLVHVTRRIQVAQIIAALIPLLAAILIVLIGPADVTGFHLFRLLVIALIALGMFGFCLSITAATLLRKTVLALTGPSSAG